MRISDCSSDVCSSDLDLGEYLVLHSYNYRKHDPPPEVLSAPPASWAPGTRYCDQPMDWRTRLVGIGGTMAVIGLALGCALFTWHVVRPIVAPPSMTVVNLQSFEAPPEPGRGVPDGPGIGRASGRERVCP